MGAPPQRPPSPPTFLKWAGGKAKLAPAILERAPAQFGAYHEPFAGAASVFFAFHAAGRITRPGKGRLTDANPDLIECFTVVRDCVDDLLGALDPLEAAYLPAGHDARASLYYETRADAPCDPVRRAARLIFLNRTCYNGLYRVNRRGQFNVPHGRYARPRICDEPTLRAASGALQGVELHAGDFAGACALAEPGDFVYLDPPYHPLSRTAHFTAYTRDPFAHDEQLRLRDTFDALTARGVHAILSNSDHPAIRALYANRELTLETVPMSRAINSKPTARAPIEELLVSNMPR
ncbi:MAG: Dam family site-specific DNA-(adenine-N6)-methyltransferase [Dehalococcoidia bacterium]